MKSSARIVMVLALLLVVGSTLQSCSGSKRGMKVNSSGRMHVPTK